MRPLAFLSLTALLLLTSCFGSGAVEYKDVTVGDTYQLRVPRSMKPSNELHDFARLQYTDEESGYFLIGIDESKSDLNKLNLYYQLEDYAHFVTRTVAEGLDTVNIAAQQTDSINGLSVISTDLFGAMVATEEPLEVYYRLMVLESDHNFYQLIAWTSRDRATQFRPLAEEIECSFVELATAGKDNMPNNNAGGSQPAGSGDEADE